MSVRMRIYAHVCRLTCLKEYQIPVPKMGSLARNNLSKGIHFPPPTAFLQTSVCIYAYSQVVIYKHGAFPEAISHYYQNVVVSYNVIFYNVIYNIFYNIYNIFYNVLYNIFYNIFYDIFYTIQYNILYNIFYHIFCSIHCVQQTVSCAF